MLVFSNITNVYSTNIVLYDRLLETDPPSSVGFETQNPGREINLIVCKAFYVTPPQTCGNGSD